jgi:hypothetical protein
LRDCRSGPGRMKSNLKNLTAAIVAGISVAARTEECVDPPLPPVESVLKRLVANSEKENANDRAFSDRYSYIRTKVMEFRNSKGDLKKREERKIQNNPATVPVALGTPSMGSDADLDKNQAENQAATETHSNVRGRAFEKRDFALNEELLSRFQFNLAGREMIGSRPTLVVEFRPAGPRLPERNMKDRFINKAAGRVWVDEEDSVLVKAELYLTDKVYVLGGLVGAVWKFNYGFHRERMPDGLWFTRTVDWHLEGREVIVRRTVDYHEEKAEVRKAWQKN